MKSRNSLPVFLSSKHSTAVLFMMILISIVSPPLVNAQWVTNGTSTTTSVYTSGKVGIGTASPTQKLQIDNGNQLVRGINNFASNNSATNPWGGDEAIMFLGDENHYIKSKRGKGVLIRTYSNVPISANADIQYANGIYLQEGTLNVGIGTNLATNTANYKLSVNGGIRAKSLVVESGWPDFVFEQAYELPTLKHVQDFVSVNGHLQGVPSAAEVAANGVDVGAMEAKLLQKVEELTLYVIKLQHEIDELRK